MAGTVKDTEILNQEVLSDFPAANRYLVGVSGGRDSVALLHALLSRGYRKLIVCHLNHRLRGRSSEADARFVASLAKKNELGFELGSVDVAKRAEAEKQSIETAAREERYAFFARVARRRRCSHVFLAHHADDLVETFLLNLFRGAANEGLGSIRPVSKRENLTVVRPMLGTWREEIDSYIRKHRLKFREDASNRSLKSTRNRFRHRIIPLLEKEFGRGIRKSIWRAASIAADEEEWLRSLLPEISRELSVTELAGRPIAWQRRIIRQWLRNEKVSNIDFESIERVRALLDTDGVAKTNLPGDRHARRRAKKIFLEASESSRVAAR
ncbi:MAG: tRNA lysidine(34) synthetase TilS [Verrucomicrobiota bacterium]|nr:tRNA lysidine(34) synthetase TilS [Verrucomicrobiota bacterium]